MADRVASHYSENLKLADVVAQNLQSAGRDFNNLTTADLATVDEFHIRGALGARSVDQPSGDARTNELSSC